MSASRGKRTTHVVHWRWRIVRPNGSNEAGDWVRHTKKGTRVEQLNLGTQRAAAIIAASETITGWSYGGQTDLGVQ